MELVGWALLWISRPMPVKQGFQQFLMKVFYIIFFFLCGIMQECANPGCQVAMAAKFDRLASNISGSSAWNLLDGTFLASRIWR
jgi:hypothetical protein